MSQSCDISKKQVIHGEDIEIVSPEQLRESIGRVFATKGEKIVEMNQKAFEIGRAHV